MLAKRKIKNGSLRAAFGRATVEVDSIYYHALERKKEREKILLSDSFAG